MRRLRKTLINADSSWRRQSVDRALQLLERLAACGGANLSQLARDTCSAVSTCHRLLTALQGRGFVHDDRRVAQWAVGSRALAVGTSFANARDLVAFARHAMEQAARESGETVNLAAASRNDVLSLCRINPRVPAGACLPAAGSHSNSLFQHREGDPGGASRARASRCFRSAAAGRLHREVDHAAQAAACRSARLRQTRLRHRRRRKHQRLAVHRGPDFRRVPPDRSRPCRSRHRRFA